MHIFAVMDASAASYPMGPQALLALKLLCLLPEEEMLGEPFQDYLDRLEELQTSQLLDVIAAASRLLGSASRPREVPPLIITGRYRIFLGSLDGPEIRMRPMAKALFLLLLRHPEGIALKNIDEYGHELSQYYRVVSNSSSSKRIEESLERLLDLESREVNVSVARIRKAFGNLIDNDSICSYLPTGEYGGIKRITLDRRYVHWLD